MISLPLYSSAMIEERLRQVISVEKRNCVGDAKAQVGGGYGRGVMTLP